MDIDMLNHTYDMINKLLTMHSTCPCMISIATLMFLLVVCLLDAKCQIYTFLIWSLCIWEGLFCPISFNNVVYHHIWLYNSAKMAQSWWKTELKRSKNRKMEPLPSTWRRDATSLCCWPSRRCTSWSLGFPVFLIIVATPRLHWIWRRDDGVKNRGSREPQVLASRRPEPTGFSVATTAPRQRAHFAIFWPF